jgi:hypothetical protein
MKRFLMLVGVAVVAAAMYVAASPGSQQSAGPTTKQFNALKKQVAALTKKVKTAQNDANIAFFAYVHCSVDSTIGVSQRGDSGGTFGYSFTPQGGGTAVLGTALDLVTSGTPSYTLTPFNTSDSACVQLVHAAPLRHNAGSLLAQFAQRR